MSGNYGTLDQIAALHNQRQMRLGLGSDLGATEIDRFAKYELSQHRLLGLIGGMEQLRQ